MARNPDRGRNIAIGCLMMPLGAMSGGMTGVLVSKIAQWVTKGPTCSGIPTCDWYIYAGWGALLGVISLPALVSWRLLQSAPPRDITTDTNRS
jgi:hypothetical protein